jgi:TonB family protein
VRKKFQTADPPAAGSLTIASQLRALKMSESWKRWEGQTVDGKFPLQSWLGGSDHSAVFETVTGDSGKAAIKLIHADPSGAEKQLLRWKTTSELKHPNLIRILAMGRCEVEGTALLYLVMEYAEENLAQIIPERTLTAEEVGAMMPPILVALQGLHDKKLVLGHIQPSNILAVGDRLKLASDSLRGEGEKIGNQRLTGYDPPEVGTGVASASGDIWQLGMTMVEVLTQRMPVWDRARTATPDLPATVPEPFRGIAWHCLQIEPSRRWTAAQISEYLEKATTGAAGAAAVGDQTSTLAQSHALSAGSVESKAAEDATPNRTFDEGELAGRSTSKKWAYALVFAAVVVAAIFLIARPKSSGPQYPTPQSSTAPIEQLTPAQPDSGAGNSAATTNPVEKPASVTSSATSDSVVKRVTPEVSAGARRTIHGKIIVRVKVNVDAAGNVEKAKIESGRGSKYFSRVALDAARDWKFTPAQAGETGDRQWKLQFAFSRAETDASVVSAGR